MPEIYRKQPIFKCSAYGPLTKNRKGHKNLKIKKILNSLIKMN